MKRLGDIVSMYEIDGHLMYTSNSLCLWLNSQNKREKIIFIKCMQNTMMSFVGASKYKKKMLLETATIKLIIIRK